MSDEIAQDDEGGFEFADVGNPDDSDDEEAAIGGKGNANGSNARSAPPAYSTASGAAPEQSQSRGAPKPLSPRDSFDGETIFAVGEDGDRFSDDEDDDEEERKLVGTSKK